jgi:hypothetical protein
MDGLSATSSITAVITLATHIGSMCNRYYFGVKNARSDIQRIIEEVASLSDILQDLKTRVESPSGSYLAISRSFNQPDGPIQKCYLELKAIEDILNASTGAKWSWPFREKDVAKMVASIDRHKSNLELGLISG